MPDGSERLLLASLQLAVLGTALLALGRLPGKWRAWGWRLVALKSAVLLVGAIGLPLLTSEPLPIVDPLTVPVASSSTDTAPVMVATSADAQRPLVSWLAAWLAVAGFLAMRILVLSARPLRNLRPLPPEWPPVSTRYCIRVCDQVQAPMIVGLWRPCVVLPAWTHPPTGWEAAMAHELAHARRRDVLWDSVLQFFACLFWFHPMAWIALREHRVACEEACDAEAIRQTGGSVRDYALTLVTLGRPIAGGLALGSPARTLRRRIHAMHRRPLSVRWSIPILALGFVLALPLELTAAPDNVDIPASRFDHIATSMLGRASVQKALGVTQKQLDEIDAAGKAIYPRMREIGQKAADMKKLGVPVKERIEFEGREKEKFYNDVAQATLDRLSPGQIKRLRELAIQRFGPLSLSYPEIGKAAGISSSSRQRLTEINRDARRAMIALGQAQFRTWVRKHNAGFGLNPEEKARYEVLSKEIRNRGLRDEKLAEYYVLEEKIVKALRPPSGLADMSGDRKIWVRSSGQALAALTSSERRAWVKVQGKSVPSGPGEVHVY